MSWRRGPTKLTFCREQDRVDRAKVPKEVDFVQDQPPPVRISHLSVATWDNGLTFNEANMVPLGSNGDIPLQVTYEAANCKLFSTWEMARSVEALWKKVVEVAWKGGKCVKGSTTERDQKMGGVPKYRNEVEDEWRLEKGPGSTK